MPEVEGINDFKLVQEHDMSSSAYRSIHILGSDKAGIYLPGKRPCKSRKRRPVAISAAILNLSCQGITSVLPLRNRRSSKLP
ncbi:hypothetical protein L6164_013298 [Bauhinia variegata]|uniref:Uncharacterized protein n=1 Tax=Bauhinia variegata TaxID=167791 RepID=A0ACB9PBM7_BAUVA|nr:hypothetical protein L6164_013298 [Bauhinia variegata]